MIVYIIGYFLIGFIFQIIGNYIVNTSRVFIWEEANPFIWVFWPMYVIVFAIFIPSVLAEWIVESFLS